jgi:hypothetical protein
MEALFFLHLDAAYVSLVAVPDASEVRLRVHKFVQLVEDGHTANRIDDPLPTIAVELIRTPSGRSVWKKYSALVG